MAFSRRYQLKKELDEKGLRFFPYLELNLLNVKKFFIDSFRPYKSPRHLLKDLIYPLLNLVQLTSPLLVLMLPLAIYKSEKYKKITRVLETFCMLTIVMPLTAILCVPAIPFHWLRALTTRALATLSKGWRSFNERRELIVKKLKIPMDLLLRIRANANETIVMKVNHLNNTIKIIEYLKNKIDKAEAIKQPGVPQVLSQPISTFLSNYHQFNFSYNEFSVKLSFQIITAEEPIAEEPITVFIENNDLKKQFIQLSEELENIYALLQQQPNSALAPRSHR